MEFSIYNKQKYLWEEKYASYKESTTFTIFEMVGIPFIL